MNSQDAESGASTNGARFPPRPAEGRAPFSERLRRGPRGRANTSKRGALNSVARWDRALRVPVLGPYKSAGNAL